MKYSTIIGLISKHLADELVSESEMLSYMDRVVDDINARLNTTFPTFSEFKEQQFDYERAEDHTPVDLDYIAIPDKYIRTVIIPGAAHKYYTTDEEGGFAAPKYADDYNQGLFYMERDFSFRIPAEYRADEQGFIDINFSEGGFDVPPTVGGLF